MRDTKKENKDLTWQGEENRDLPATWLSELERMSNGERGRWGEEAALAYYRARSFRLLEQNFRCPFGEIDLIVERGDCLRFVEVKARSQFSYGRPADFVDKRKRDKIRRTAMHFLSQKVRQSSWTYYLFDIVEVDLKKKRIHCIPNAFALSEGR